MKKLLLAICLATAQTALAQTADTRIGTLINESMTAHYFNRPDSACIAIGTVLNEHQEEIGGQNSVNMAALMATNLTRCTRYEEAAALMQSLAQQLQAQGVDSATTASILKAADLYTMYARESPLCPASRPSAARFIRQANTTSPSRSTTTCTRDTRSRGTS